MYLKKIKISGFKSFVDTTTLHFPHDMTAVVGPNGCGKSNIIDAVRWVLGESSAKHLRGDAMADVIFNGSSARAPVSRASVELSFDNTLQRVDHALSQYNEIAIRRELFRDGNNQYYLNGKKCRRKDVTELFLGTGLGPRSYAIIEQGMISRLIESKPHELRNFIEEAAGISKYKEKRRETEQRIKQTRDNLSRLSDIRIELDRQIEKLKEQSIVAQRFRELKKEQREAKAKLSLVQINDLERNNAQLSKQHDNISTELRDVEAKLIAFTSEMNELSAQKDALDIVVSEGQDAFYKQGSQVSKLEQEILHYKSRLLESTEKVKQLTQQEKQLHTLLLQEQKELQDLELKYSENERSLTSIQDEIDRTRVTIESTASEKKSLSDQQSKAISKENTLKTQVEKVQNQLDHAEIVLAKSTAQSDALLLEQSAILALDQQANIELKSAELDKRKANVVKLNERLQTEKAQLNGHLQECEKLKSALVLVDEKRQILLEKRAVNLGQLKQEKVSPATERWLSDTFSAKPDQLLASLHVESGWELAVEKVLADWLDAYDIELSNLSGLDIDSIPEIRTFQTVTQAISSGSLAEKVTNPVFHSLLNNVICVDDRQSAVLQLETNSGNSYITPQGDWFRQDGAALSSTMQDSDEHNESRIALQQQVNQQTVDLDELVHEINVQKSALSTLEHLIVLTKDDVEQITQQRQLEQTHSDKLNVELQLLNQQQQTWLTNKNKIQVQLSAIDTLLVRERHDVKQHQDKQKELVELVNNLPSQDSTIRRLDELEQQLLALTRAESAAADKRQTVQIAQATFRAEISKQKALIEKTILQSADIASSMTALNVDTNIDRVLEKLESRLTEFVKAQLALETAQIKNKEQSSQLAESRQIIQLKHDKLLKSSNKLKDRLQQLALKQANSKAKEQLLYQQAQDDNVDIVTLKRDCVNMLTNKEYQQILVKLDSELHAIGPVNLAAVEEFDKQSERSNYLAEQTDDLEKAMATLETAIVKIDKQTRARFSTTFEKINTDFKALFPKVFGGGAAWLELTSNNVLDAGVTIMARPPGKKNARISLLSGGEKALTALSLVFAIFRLNPAPFCMLDEVDAPLDELNVTRFCKLVQEMSETVQFIYISHNKLAMEMAEQLIGVTMHEPGVSRIVAVDISAAMKLTDN